MSDLHHHLGRLVNGGVELWADADRLHFKKAVGKLTDDERAFLKAHKEEIRAFVGDRRVAWLSGVQQRIWFISRYAPEATAYTIPFLFDLPDDVDLDRLESAFGALTRRHLALRASFPDLMGVPVQVFAPRVEVLLRVHPLPEDPAAQEEEVRARLVQPFALDDAPLFRVYVFRAPQGRMQLGLSMHHLIGDGWSIRLMMRDLATFYEGAGPVAPAPTIVDALRSERAIGADVTARDLRYWRERLAAPPVLALPCDRERPRHLTYDGGQVRADLDADLSRRLKAQARARNTTVFTLLMGAFGVFLKQHTGQRDLMIGIPFAARESREAQAIVGCMMSTLVLRLQVEAEETSNGLAAQVSTLLREAAEHSTLSFDRVVESLGLERDTSRNPVFQVLFGQIPSPEVGARGLPLRHRYLDAKKCQFDLEYYYSDGDADGPITSFFVYNSNLFDEATAALFAERWLQLVEWLVEHPDGAVREAPRLAPSIAREVRERWNATDWAWDDQRDVSERIAHHGASRAEKIAVLAGAQACTYGQLHRQVGRVATSLRRAGVGPGVLVGVQMDRSVEMVLALLAILRTGAAFVPIDTVYPPERIRYMVETSEASHVLTDDPLADLPDGVQRIVWSEALAFDGPVEEPVRRSRGDLAYVMFTSGSTGRPKGVAITDGSLLNLLLSMAKAPGLASDDRLLAVTSLSFDISLLELLLPLIRGATLRVATREEQTDPAALVRYLDHDAVTVMQGTPSTWRMLLDHGWEGSPRLRVLCGGEALSDDLARALGRRCASLWNVYGPTETTIWSARRRIEPGGGRVTLGHPIENTRLYVLDEDQRPVPCGVPGELCIGGDGVGLGYIGRGDLTAQRFPTLDIPELGVRGERVYRTGDLVRQLTNGEILFLGRLDQQVKVSGHRIELGEVEARLAEVPGIAHAVVVVQGAENKSRLVAFLLAVDEPVPTDTVLAHLRRHLPAYMVPQLKYLDKFPQTLNGKVDRAALSLARHEGSAPAGPREAPRGEHEARVAEWFAKVLEVELPHRGADFFELGGQSLLAIRVLSLINEEYHLDMRLPEFFQVPTVAGVAERIEELLDERVRTITEEVERLSDDEITRELERLGLL